MSFETVVQEVIYQALKNNAELDTLGIGVYDHVPQQSSGPAVARFPYVVVGEDVHNEWDTDNTIGTTASITVHVWSQVRGRSEVKKIQGIIYDALHRARLHSEGYNIISCDFEISNSFMEADALTRHGVQTFRLLIDKIT